MFNAKKSTSRYTLMFALGCAFLGTNNVVTQSGIAQTQPLLFSGVRMLLIGLLLLPFVIRSHKKLSPEGVSSIFVNTSLLLFVMVVWTYALDYTSALTLTFMGLLMPMFVYLGSLVFLKERFSSIALIGSILGLTGGFIVVFSPLLGDASAIETSTLGNALGLATSMGMAGLALHTKETFKHASVFNTLSYRSILVGIVMSIAGIMMSNGGDFAAFATLNLWSAIIVSSIIGGAIGLWLFYGGLKNLRAEDSAPIFYLDPLVGFMLAVVLLGDQFTIFSGVGSFIILTGVLIAHPVHMERFHFYMTPHHSRWQDFKKMVSGALHTVENVTERLLR